MRENQRVQFGAVLSDDGLYRYRLTRQWDDQGRLGVFVMLNPSTADAERDDPTIRRCIGFCKSWGLGSLEVVNLYAYRATKPNELLRVSDPVGPENDWYLIDALSRADVAIAAWGNHGKRERVTQVIALPGADRLECLGTTKAGTPRHPLYVRKEQQPVALP
ncbi:MAG: DUF1643 domain-containing protein [Propionibacteriaceae bacterium]|jgi:hypothetical protein|nr:DUF1643 domain-containing protein [Propionibacteriaceae bacterium]